MARKLTKQQKKMLSKRKPDTRMEYLEMLKQIRGQKDMDEIAELFMGIIRTYGLTLDEVCSLCYVMTKEAVNTPQNSTLLREKFNIDVSTLGIDGLLAVIKAGCATYFEKVKDNGTA